MNLVFFRPSIECVTHMETSPTANIDLFSAFKVIKWWWFCTGPHLPWHRTSIYMACLAFAYILKSFSVLHCLETFYLQFPRLLFGMTIPLRHVLASVSQILHFIIRSYPPLIFKLLPIVYIFHILFLCCGGGVVRFIVPPTSGRLGIRISAATHLRR